MIKGDIADSTRTYLERSFPVKELNRMALLQSNARMPVYQIHKWWARRLGTVFRSIIISSFLEPTSQDFWHNYYNGFTLKDKLIYDPFMGGGTTIIEGTRLGCRVIGNDINPVAWFLTKKSLDPFNIREADTIFEGLYRSVGERIRSFYQTECNNGHSADTLYCLWIRQINCRSCMGEFDLFNNFEILDKHGIRTIFCPRCNDIFTTRNRGERLKCKKGHLIDLKSTPVRKGIFTCPNCDARETISSATKRIGGPLKSRIFSIEYYCAECGRGFKKASQKDLKLFNDAKDLLENAEYEEKIGLDSEIIAIIKRKAGMLAKEVYDEG